MKHLTSLTAAAAVAATLVAVPAAAGAAAFPACTAAHLRITLGHQRAAMGHIQYTITAENTGPACVLTGYPELGLENARRERLYSHTTGTRTTWFGRGPGRGPCSCCGTWPRRPPSRSATSARPVPCPPCTLTAGGKAARIPGGLAWVYGGLPRATASTAGKAA
jgi:Domain of unknown function (DUF4232)